MGRSQIIFCLFLAACSGADFKSLSKSDLNSSEPTVDSQQEDEFTQAQEPTSITGTNLTDSYVQAFRAPPTSPENENPPVVTIFATIRDKKTGKVLVKNPERYAAFISVTQGSQQLRGEPVLAAESPFHFTFQAPSSSLQSGGVSQSQAVRKDLLNGQLTVVDQVTSHKITTSDIFWLECGNAGNSCYDHPGAFLGNTMRIADTGTLIELKPADPNCVEASNCFKIWKEKEGNRIINSTGFWSSIDSSMQWQKKLNPSGDGWSSDYFTYPINTQKIENRACPTGSTLPNVFISSDSPNTKFATGRCLYYQKIVSADDSKGSNAQSIINPFKAGAWYTGGNFYCGIDGMRLPTLFETNISNVNAKELSGQLPVAERIITWPENSGVPSEQGIITATSWANSGLFVAKAASWPTSADATTMKCSDNSCFIRCVIP